MTDQRPVSPFQAAATRDGAGPDGAAGRPDLEAEIRRLRAEKAALEDLLAERSDVLGQLVEGVIITDPAGRITFVNAAAERLHGVALLDVPPDQYSAAYSLFTEDGRPHPPAELPLARAVLRGETVAEARWRILRPDGTQVLAIGSARPVKGADGRTVAHVLTVRDDTAREAAATALRESERQLRLLADGLPMLVAYIGADLRYRVANRAYVDWFGKQPAEIVGRPVTEVIGDAAFERVRPQIEAALEGRAGRLECWVPYKDGPRFVRADYIPHRGGTGRVEGLFVAVADDTERRAAEENQRLLMREVDHRAKNALAVVQAILRLTRAESQEDFVSAVDGRVAALARSHMLLAKGSWAGAKLADMVRDELAPFLAAGEGRLVLAGEDVTVHADSTQPLALILHEMATNAAKHGALSTPEGRVTVAWGLAPPDQLWIEWKEEGGPPILAPPTRQGFGSELIGQAALSQLGGSADYQWEPSGLRCRITAALDPKG